MKDAVQSVLTILFEAPFWVGLYERVEDGEYRVCKITFGGEPKDYEVYAFILRHRYALRFSPPVQGEGPRQPRVNPKRVQREIGRQLESRGIGTKAQQALKAQREQGRLERKARGRALREAEEARRYALRQEKKKAKRRGR